jgi:hypothetical protein
MTEMSPQLDAGWQARRVSGNLRGQLAEAHPAFENWKPFGHLRLLHSRSSPTQLSKRHQGLVVRYMAGQVLTRDKLHKLG